MNPDGDLRAQNVMDNLIFRPELPVMIGVFINPGRRPDQPGPNASEWGERTTNRLTEYNALDDKYARDIVGDLMPVLFKEYNISGTRKGIASAGQARLGDDPQRRLGRRHHRGGRRWRIDRRRKGRNRVVFTKMPGPLAAGLARVEEGSWADGQWVPGRRLNGDEIMSGKELRLPGDHYAA